MAYTDNQSRADRAKSIAGVVAVHGALGYALLVGLQASGVIEQPPRLTGTTVTVPVAPPPEPEPEPRAGNPPSAASPLPAPTPPRNWAGPGRLPGLSGSAAACHQHQPTRPLQAMPRS